MSARGGRPRRDLITSMCPRDRLIIDVGADHGYVAAAVGGIATELEVGRCGKTSGPWVVADGLRPFSEVPCAVITGMGALTIQGILERGPRPAMAIVHATDDPPALRIWLAQNGFRIDAEGLAPEANRYAEVIRVVPGTESATGLLLEFGPRLLEHGDPWLDAHLTHLHRLWSDIAAKTRTNDEDRHQYAAARVDFLHYQMTRSDR